MTERQSQWFGGVGSLVLIAATCVAVTAARGDGAPSKARDVRSAEAKSVTGLRVEAQELISSGKGYDAEQRLTQLVEEYADSDDKDTQDQVAAAGMTLGYLAANRGEYEKARERFEETSEGYAGTGSKHPDYGRVDDQAAYQAIVCLQAEGKKGEAVKEYVAFLQGRQDSPLVFAVHKRLTKLDPDNAAEYEALLQAAIAEKERQIRKELAMCGPRAVQHLLKVLDKEPKSDEELFKLCKTTEDGTTLADMAGALESLGIQSKGMRLNYPDFERQQTPFIWLTDSHYVVVLGWERGAFSYYDPMYRSIRTNKLDDEQATKFSAVVLTVSDTLKEQGK